MRGMASSRKRTAQPFAKGQGARTPGEPLSAALAGKPALGANPANPDRELQKGAAAPTSGKQGIRELARRRAAGKLSDALKAKMGGSESMPTTNSGPSPFLTPPSLATDLEKPANQSTSRTGSTRPKQPAQKTYLSKGEINQTGNERAGKDFATFTVKGKAGEYHEYVDPTTGKRSVKYVKPKPKAGPAKGL